MDTRTTPIDVEASLALIKSEMPETYKAINAKAKDVGKAAFGLVRRAIKGEANCFWACERGHVVGTPFAMQEIERDVAQLMVQFGATFVCIWGREVTHGAN